MENSPHLNSIIMMRGGPAPRRPHRPLGLLAQGADLRVGRVGKILLCYAFFALVTILLWSNPVLAAPNPLKAAETAVKGVIVVASGVAAAVAATGAAIRWYGQHKKNIEGQGTYEHTDIAKSDDSLLRGGGEGGGGDEPPPRDSAVGPQRYLVARAAGGVKVGIPFTLTARISTEALPSATGQSSAAVTGEVTGKLKISIYAPAFDSNDGTQREIDVPATGTSSWAPFELVARKAGVQSIEVLAWKNSAQVGGITISIGVDAARLDHDSVQSRLEMREPEEGEYTLEVTLEEDLNRYRFQLRSNTGDNWPPMYSETLEGTTHSAYASVISRLNAQARNANHLSSFAQGEWLKGMGGTLYKSLIPADLKDALWENREKIKYLNILSATEPMPWELLYVSDAHGACGKFLADTAIVSRWRYGPPPGRYLSRQNPYFVLPDGSPTNAQEEVTYVRNMLGAGRTIAQLDDLLELLNTGQFSLLHFASHNIVAPTGTGGLYIPFGNARFDDAFMGSWLRQFRCQSPLVFMNSCTSGGAAPLYTEMAGWADGFLKAGCGAFIGSLWEIRTTSALTFASKFYDEVIGGENLGESMRAARNALSPTDPTSLAYTLYGNPLARFV